MLFSLICKPRKYPESIRLAQGPVGGPLSQKLFLSFFGFTDVTMEASMIIQSEIHVLLADLAVFLPNVMFIKTAIIKTKQRSHSGSQLEMQSGITFLITRINQF